MPANMGRLILVRHGESEGNRQRVFAEHTEELPLTDVGYGQAQAVAQCIASHFRTERIVSSPYRRARETARVIAERLGHPVEVEPQLHEREVGAYRGQPYASMRSAADYDLKRPWAWTPRGGESFVDVKARVGPILDRLASDSRGRDVVIVSHGGVMLTLWAHVTGQWAALHTPPNCGIVIIEHDARGYAMPQVFGNAESAAHEGG
jgi:probable phosphoglycerate mutase